MYSRSSRFFPLSSNPRIARGAHAAWLSQLAWLALVALLPGCDCGRPAADADSGAVDAGDQHYDGSGGGTDSATADTGAADSGLPATVRINEIVPYPVNDWNQSMGGGAPYQQPPGTGAVTSLDEYVELYNEGPGVANLTGWVLDITGSEVRARTVLGVDGVLVTSPGSTLSALQPGGFAVIGNPDESLTTDAYVVLYDATGAMIDDVEIGGISDGRDREGDGPGDGAPSPDRNGFARGSFEEAIARPIGQPDTDDDQADFVAMNATPLKPNEPLTPPVESIAPQVVAHATGTRFATTELLWVEFDEPMDALSFDGNVEVHAESGAIALGFHTFERSDRVLVINPIGKLPFAQDITVTVRGGAGGVTDLAGNALAGDLTFTVHTENAPLNPGSVVISEICASPVQDWDDTVDGDGMPFSPVPGSGEVSSSDEWIELLIMTPGPLDLSFYSITIYNGPNIFGPTQQKTRFNANQPVIRVFGTGTAMTSVRQGDRVIMGNPIGTIREDAYLALRDGSGRLVDTVEIGGNTADSDRGGDGIENGAPAAGAGGTSTGLFDETISRSPADQDSGDDVADFVYSSATPGVAN